MRENTYLSDELWGALYPIARLYVYYVFPLILILFFCSLIGGIFVGGASLEDLVVLLLLASFSWLYGSCFRDLKAKRPVHISAGMWINPGDSIAWGRLMVGIVILTHSGAHLIAITTNFQRW